MTRSIQPPISDERLDGLVRRLLTERAEDIAVDALSGDAMSERIATRLSPSPMGRTWVLVAAAMLAALLIGGALAVGGQLRLPFLPSPAPQRPGWTGPVQANSEAMPVLFMERNPGGEFIWADGQDADLEFIDIGDVDGSDGEGFRRLDWRFELAGIPGQALTLDPTQRLVEYGVVLDSDEDGVADCLIRISNENRKGGEHHVWVTNLRTNMTDELIGPPYSGPIDFAGWEGGKSSGVRLFFTSLRPCVDSSSTPIHFYAWASLTDSGRVTAWDYAPDRAWLAVPGPLDQP